MGLREAVEEYFRVVDSDGPMMDWDAYFEAEDKMRQALDQYKDTINTVCRCPDHIDCGRR